MPIFLKIMFLSEYDYAKIFFKDISAIPYFISKGLEIRSKTFFFSDKEFCVQLWHKMPNISSSLYIGSQGIILIHNIAEENLLKKLDLELEEFSNYISKKIPVLLLGINPEIKESFENKLSEKEIIDYCNYKSKIKENSYLKIQYLPCNLKYENDSFKAIQFISEFYLPKEL
jgi:hypothetical protein